MFLATYASTNFERFNEYAPGDSVSGIIISKILSRKFISFLLKKLSSLFVLSELTRLN